jgi:hypothetical protein
MVEIERLHRGRGDAENLIRGAKQTGLENLPFREFNLNAVWLELSLIAQDLIAWTQRLCLDGGARDLRTESASLPAAAHRRPALLPRPPRSPAPPSQLAMGQRTRRRVRPTTRAAVLRRLINQHRLHEHNDEQETRQLRRVLCCRENPRRQPSSTTTCARRRLFAAAITETLRRAERGDFVVTNRRLLHDPG